jgi:hypothetical protein
MVRDVAYLCADFTYKELQHLLTAYPRLHSFPLVDKQSSTVLLGSVTKRRLQKLLEQHVTVLKQKVNVAQFTFRLVKLLV